MANQNATVRITGILDAVGIAHSSWFQAKCTLCGLFLFFIFLCPGYNLAVKISCFVTIIPYRSML